MSNPLVSFPFDCDAALARSGWRTEVAWPRTLTETDAGHRAAWTAFWNLIGDLDGLSRDSLLLVGGRLFLQGLAIAEAANVTQAARSRNFVMQGGPPAVRKLAGDDSAVILPETLASAFKAPASPSFIAARRLYRSLALSPLRAWPRISILPQVYALSHNPLMKAYAADEGIAVIFRHSESYFAEVRRREVRVRHQQLASEVAMRMSEMFLDGRDLDTVCCATYREMMVPFFERSLLEAARDITAIREVGSLPAYVWIGSSGYYPSRLVAQEVRRRGGHVTSFEHGWGAGCESVAELLTFGDLPFVDSYVAYTSASAAKLAAHSANGLALPGKTTTYLASRGDPFMKRLPLRRNGTRAGRTRVLYAPTITLGLRQMTPPLPADPIYLNWQFDLCEALAAMPVDFTCQPHPEGFFRNRLHPLNAMPYAAGRPFEDLIGDTDVFIFDWMQSTTFGSALCSDRPIILLDFGTRPFDAETEVAIRRRCRVIQVSFDEFNRPVVPVDVLRDAVLDIDSAPPDNSYFRALMIGL